MGHPIEPFAREAFAAGWAVSGGPMTSRIQAATRTAVALAVEHADDPHVLEVTVDLGKLEGMWALLFQRREQIIHQYVGHVTTAWRPLISRDAVGAAVRDLRHQMGLSETTDPERASIAAAAAAAARRFLQALTDRPGWANLRSVLRNAIAAGRAEGMVNAVAVAAERASRISLDWNIAFDHAYTALGNLDELWGDADTWIGRLIDRAENDLGRALANAAEQGASYEDMVGAAADVLDGGDIEAVKFVVDWAMTTAADEGAAALYASEGVARIDIITAGDGRVCEACLDAETGSPWTLGDQPRMPLHPLCRCVYAADVNLDHFATWFT